MPCFSDVEGSMICTSVCLCLHAQSYRQIDKYIVHCVILPLHEDYIMQILTVCGCVDVCVIVIVRTTPTVTHLFLYVHNQCYNLYVVNVWFYIGVCSY